MTGKRWRNGLTDCGQTAQQQRYYRQLQWPFVSYQRLAQPVTSDKGKGRRRIMEWNQEV